MRATLLATLALAAQSNAHGQEENGGDTTTIRWVLPGDFAQARRRAEEQQRMLIVEGVSFGIDHIGAKCATKGVW